MDALTEALWRQLKRQQEIERRLSRIEEALGLAREPGHEEKPPAAEPEAAPSVESPPAPSQPARPVPAAPGRGAFETRMGLTWLNRVGAITLVLGIAFFFKYAVDNQWIGESGRVALGVVAGFVFMALADRLWHRGQQTFANGISGTGIAILYLSFYAAFGFYDLIPQSLAFALMALSTAAAGALALRYGSAAIAVLGMIGGYLTPVVLSTGTDRPWFLFGYVLVLNAGAILVARARNWRGLEALAFLATVALYLSWLVSFLKPEKKLVANVFALVYFGLFATSNIRGVFAAAQLVATIELLLVSLPQPLPFLPLAALVCGAGLVIADRRGWPEAPLAAFAAFWLPYALAHLAFKTHGTPGVIFGFLTVVFFLFLGWIPWRSEIRKLPVRRQELILLALNAAAYFGASYDLLEPGYHSYIGLFAIALAGLHVALGYELWRNARGGGDLAPILLYLGIALALVTLAAPIQFTGFRITLIWSLETAALAWIGMRTRDVRLTWAALAAGILVLLRLTLIDAWVMPGTAFWNARFLTFTTAAVCFWLAAHWAKTGWSALAPYVAGHGMMLWALIAEVLEWEARSASPENLRNVQSTSVSILLAAYAVLLVGIGVAARSAVNRLLGLGLILAIAAKLYFYDVWRIGRMYRVAAFAGLGMFLLLTSYLYSRYRTSIENWWKDERTGS